jgi:uncharacterized protein
MRDHVLSVALDVIGRVFLRRDRQNGEMQRLLDAFAFEQTRLTIRSGSRDLSAVYVRASDDAPLFLICHGIGEQVEYWSGVQKLLKTMGTSSLVFNYSGYGASTGPVSAAHCEEDAIADYRKLATDRGVGAADHVEGCCGAVADRRLVGADGLKGDGVASGA